MAQQMVTTDTTNNGANDNNQQQQKQLSLQYLSQSSHPIDVRMKRHPELQPFVPSDRSLDRERNLAFKGPTRIATNLNDAKLPSSKPKKCVSMTRLNQLAQPKRVLQRNPPQTTSTLPSSSLSSSITTSSSLKSTATNSKVKITSSSGKQTSRPGPVSPDKVQKEYISPPKVNNHDSLNQADRSSQVDREPSNDSNSIKELSVSSTIKGLDNSSFTQASENLTTNGNSISDKSFQSLVNESDACFTTSSPTPKLSKTDEERRLRAEEELQEAARRELEEREKRTSIVDSILSRVSQSS